MLYSNDCYSILHFKLKSNAVQAIDVPAAQQADQTITRVDNEDTDDHLFSLPFMVLGSAHHSEMQTHLESAKKELEQNPLIRKDVTVRIRTEPENEKDEKAIIVEIN